MAKRKNTIHNISPACCETAGQYVHYDSSDKRFYIAGCPLWIECCPWCGIPFDYKHYKGNG